MKVGVGDGISSGVVQKVVIGPGQNAIKPVIDIKRDDSQRLWFGTQQGRYVQRKPW